MKRAIILALALALSLVCAGEGWAKTDTVKIDREVEAALSTLRENVKGGDQLLDKAKGTLVMPEIVKAGLGVGGQHGKGALVINGETVGYYSTTGVSLGAIAGAEKKSVVIAFLTEEALREFRESAGWEVGADAAVTMIDVGAQASIDTTTAGEPVVGLVFDRKGLMGDASLRGAKFTKIAEEKK